MPSHHTSKPFNIRTTRNILLAACIFIPLTKSGNLFTSSPLITICLFCFNLTIACSVLIVTVFVQEGVSDVLKPKYFRKKIYKKCFI